MSSGKKYNNNPASIPPNTEFADINRFERRGYVASLAPIALAASFVIFTAVDFVFRPKFVAIHIGSEEMSRAVPKIVSILHFALNIIIPTIGIAMAIFTKGNLNNVRYFFVVSGALVLSVICSLVFHLEKMSIIYLVVLTLNLVGAGFWMSSPYGQTRGLFAAFRAISLGLTMLLIIVLLSNEYSWGRLAARAGPNYWGMTSFLAITLSISITRLPIRSAVIAIGLAVLVLTQARGSLLATAVAAIVAIIITFHHAPREHKGWLASAGFVSLILFIGMIPYIATHILLLSDPSRGVGSGGTGREGAWKEALDAFSNNPLFGVGYRQHEVYITQASNAHNAYLATMTELGSFGIIIYLIFIGGATIRSLFYAWSVDTVEAKIVASFLTGFMFIGLVEYQSLATGSPMPILMFFAAAYGWIKRPDIRNRIAKKRNQKNIDLIDNRVSRYRLNEVGKP